MRALISMILLLLVLKGYAQHTITIQSEDNLSITADQYLKDKDAPYILLCHQANSSRGEYQETAVKLVKLGYNCLAVDLRSGKEINFIPNKTALDALEKKLPNSFLDAEKDIIAAIDYIKSVSSKKIILLGSSFSASLVMKIGNHNPLIRAVIAFSPGEYFQPKLILKNSLKDYDKNIFIASTSQEKPFIQELISEIPPNLVTFYVPKESEGIHGSKALWESQEGSSEVWLSLMLFIEKIEKE